MKNLMIISLLFLMNLTVNAQSCNEIMEFVKSKDSGTSYSSFTSDAISKVTFYEINLEGKTMYFAIVCFKQKYGYGCTEYIYQVASNTKFNYSINYINSAGKAFWEFIQPYNKNLGCAPDMN